MRSIQTGLICALAFGLLACSAVGVDATEEDWLPSPATMFYGTWANVDELSYGTGTVRRDGLVERTGYTFEADMEASDPHMDGKLLASADCLSDPKQGGRICAVTYVLTNDVGSWLGESTSLPGVGSGDIIFTGRGGYEGFIAHMQWRADSWVLDGDFSDDYQEYAFEGLFLRGEMSPFPEPPTE